MLHLEPRSSSASALTAVPAAALRWRASGLFLAHLLLIGFALSPLLWVRIPPLVDYPNHLARMAVLLHDGDGSAIASNYVAHWRLLPNLAMDLVVPALAQILPLELAGRIFVGLTMMLLILGTVALHRALYGRVGLWPLCALLFVYNAVFWFGFVNYLFGLGIALLAFSAWIASAAWPRVPRLLAFAAISAVIFVLHLFAFGVYGLLIASYEAGKFYAKRDWSKAAIVAAAMTLVPFLSAGLLWLVSAGGPQYTNYGGLIARIFALIAPSAFNDPPTVLDTLVLVIEIAAIPAALKSGVLRLSPAMRFPLIAMLFVAVLIPEYLSGSWSAQIRLPVALMFVLIASTRPDPTRRSASILLISAMLVLLGLRVSAVTQNWRDMEARMTELRAALQTLPAGVRLLPVQSKTLSSIAQPGGARRLIDSNGLQPYTHFGALAVLDRGAFFPPLFTGWTPIEPSPRNAGLSRILGGLLTPEELYERADGASYLARHPDVLIDQLGEPICCVAWPAHFDFVLWIDFGQPPNNLPPMLQPWASGSYFHIYRIKQP